MHSIASFESITVRTAHYFTLKNMFRDTDLRLLFDSGASYSVIGINNVYGAIDEGTEELFLEILKDEIIKQNISMRENALKTATGDVVETYPCVLHQAVIGASAPLDFYFELAHVNVEEPVLGRSFSDDCAYSHSIRGKIRITGILDNPSFELYKSYNVLDWNKVMARYYGENDK